MMNHRKILSSGSLCRFFCFAILGLLCACGSRDEGSGDASSPAPQLHTFAYDCDDGSYIVTHMGPEDDAITIFLPGETIRLPHIQSGSGAKYSDGKITFWTKGKEALLEIEGADPLKCLENRRRSWIEDAKLRGNDYWAAGNEPGWTLEIGPEQTVLKTNYGQDRYEFKTPEPAVDGEARHTTYRAYVDGMAIVIEISGVPCQDSMSGEAFETSVSVQLGGQELLGCGQALH